MERISDGSVGNNDLLISQHVEKLTFENFDNNKRFNIDVKTSKLGCFSGSEEEIPRFQVVRKSKRFSDNSEEQETVLPLSPVATPPSVKQSENRLSPPLYTLGAIAKRKEYVKFSTDEITDELSLDKLSVQCSCACDRLDIMDKDISWISSMETPAPQVSVSNEFNTIERATFLPENELNNMQPRVLFSPNKNDDCNFKPIRYSSESDCEETIKQTGKKIRDACELTHTNLTDSQNTDTLLKINLNGENTKGKTQDLLFGNDPKEPRRAVSPHSPVFRIEKTKKKSKRKKVKSTSVKSPFFDISFNDTTMQSISNSSCIENLNIVDKSNVFKVEVNNTKSEINCFHEQSNSIQDDSFQNMSFSCIDELVKNSVNVTDSTLSNFGNQTSILPEENSFEILPFEKINQKNPTILNEKVNQNKYFYCTGNSDVELHQVPTLDNFLKCAKKFEGNFVMDKVLEDSFANTELIVFSDMINDSSKLENFQELKTKKSPEISYTKKTPRSSNESESEPERSLLTVVNEVLNKDKFNESSQLQNSLQQNISNHFNDNDGHLDKSPSGTSINNAELHKSDNSYCSLNKEFEKVNDFKNTLVEQVNQCKVQDSYSVAFPIISTALGKSISISVQAYNKAKNIFGNELEDDYIFESKHFRNENTISSHKFQGFRTANDAVVTVSEKSLNKVKKLFQEFDEIDCEKTLDIKDNVIPRNSVSKGSKKCIKQMKNIVQKDDYNNGENESKEVRFNHDASCFKTSSDKRIKISKETLDKVKTLWFEEEDIDVKSFSTFYHKKSENQQISKEDIENSDVMEVTSGNESKSNFCGFSTASGNRVTISEKALRKANEILGEEIQKDKLRKDESWNFEEKDTNVERNKETDFQEKDCGLEEKDSEMVGDVNGNSSKDESEIIPSWLHAYNTSPAMIGDRMNLAALTSHEDRIYHSTPNEQYLVRSPVLATTDRFFNRKKRRKQGRKLEFEMSPKHLKLEEKSNFVVPCKMAVKNPAGKRCPAEINIDFTVPFKKVKLNDPELEALTFDGAGKVNEEVIESRKEARMEQVQAAKKEKVKPLKGSHFLKKREPQKKWSEVVNESLPGTYTEEELHKYGVRNDVMEVTSSNAADYKFRSLDFYSFSACYSNVRGFAVGDGCSLIFNDDNMAGVAEISRAFFASPGVEPKFISEKWIKNHYKWIVWKLSHYERSFPHIFGGRCLTPHNLLLQLKYRYDREIDLSQRSALKKILEHDDSPARRMVLCVFDIKQIPDMENKSTDSVCNNLYTLYKLGMTDGWYGCYAETDFAMTKLIENLKVTIGTKLIIQGAKLLNCDQGISPLDISENVHLKISTNSTRRAKWDTKLGFQKNNGPILVSLSSLQPQGGYIGRIDVIIVRVYPILYMEKKSDGSHVIRNRRAEDKAAAVFQQKQDEMVEKIYQQVKDEFQKKEKITEKIDKKLSISDLPNICDPEDLYRLYENCLDPSTFQSHLTTEQKNNLINYQRWKNESINKEVAETIREKINKEKINGRNITPLLRTKVIDLRKPDCMNVILFTAWNFTEDALDLLDEGKALSIFNVTATTNSRSFNSVHLNSTRQTYYRELSKVNNYPERKLTLLRDVTPDYEPLFNEIDLVGIVVFIHEMFYGSKQAQTLFLTDLDKNFAGVIFWGNFKEYGWDKILTINTVVACINLQLNKKQNLGGIPCMYANDSTIFTENPKQPYLKEEIKNLKISLPRDMKNFICKCEEDIKILLEEQKHISKNISNHNDSSFGESISLKPKYINGFKMKPNASSTPFKSFNLGLNSSDQEPSPIQKKIEKLKKYGEPPPLPNLLPLDNLEKFRTKFKVPFRNISGADSTAK